MTKQSKKQMGLGLSIWLLATLFFLYQFFLRGFVGTLADIIIHALQLSPDEFGLLGAAYYFSYGIMQIPVGFLFARFNIRWVLAAAIMGCVITTVMFVYAQHFSIAFISRIGMGAASAFAFVGLLTVTTQYLPKRYFATLIGTAQLIGTLGPMLAAGPLMSLVLARHHEWQQPLLNTALFGMILAVAILFLVRQGRAKKHAFCRTTLLSLLKKKQVWYITLYSASNYAPMALLGMTWGVYLLQAQGHAEQISANMISWAWIGYALGCAGLSLLADLFKKAHMIMSICSAIGIIGSSLLLYYPHSSEILSLLLCFSIGIAATGQNLGFARLAMLADKQHSPILMGLNNAMISLFDTVTSALIGYLLVIFAGSAALGHAFTVMPLLFLLSLILNLYLIR